MNIEKKILVIIIILVAIWFIYENVNKENMIDESKFGLKNIVNLITNFDGKEYYLASIPRTTCEESKERECLINTLVLLDYEDLIKNIKLYKNLVDKFNENCSEENQECLIKPKYIHDFMIIKNIFNEKEKSYKIYGYPDSIKSLKPSGFLINQLFGSDSKRMCVDGNLNNADHITDIKLIETNVEKSESGLTPTFKMEIDKKIKGNMIKYYLGVCTDNKCNYEGKPVKRICLYDDINNVNVLVFKALED